MDGAPATPEALAALTSATYAHFTVLPVQGGRVRGLSLHMFRLVQNTRVMFGLALDEESVREQVRRTLQDGDGNAFVRVSVHEADALPSHGAGMPHVLTTARAAGPARPEPALRVRVVEHERFLPEVKHVATLAQVYLRRQARREGFDDVLLVDRRGTVLEGAVWNVCFFDGVRVVWPVGPMLRGVVMQLVAERLGDMGVEAEERAVARDELPSFSAAFTTDSQYGVRALAAVDDVTYGVDETLLDVLRRTHELAPLERI